MAEVGECFSSDWSKGVKLSCEMVSSFIWFHMSTISAGPLGGGNWGAGKDRRGPVGSGEETGGPRELSPMVQRHSLEVVSGEGVNMSVTMTGMKVSWRDLNMMLNMTCDDVRWIAVCRGVS